MSKLRQRVTSFGASKKFPPVMFVIVIAVIGSVLILASQAATPVTSFQAENAVISGNAATIADASASGGNAVKFGTPVAAGTCQGAPFTPGGPDPWGGCWPGAFNTGYPKGLPGDTRTPVTLTNYTGSCSIREDNVVIDSKIIDCGGMLVYGRNLTIKNSKLLEPVNTNSDTASITIMDSEVDGSTYAWQSIGLTNVTAIRVNVYNNQHTIHCNQNCVVRDSWMHDQYNIGTQDWHQNGYLSNGGNNHQVSHNSVFCRGGCTADIAFIPDGNSNNVLVEKNLLLASPDSAYCFYGGDNGTTPSKPGQMTNMIVRDNIWMKGANGRCGTYGPVTGFNPNRTGNQWINNLWSDGTPVPSSL